MSLEEHKIKLPKLSPDGSNWVTYRDRLTWALQSNSIQDHIAAESPPAAYTALGTINALAPDARWRKEEIAIKQVLVSTLPDTAFNRIKGQANVKDAWDILKRVYEQRSTAMVADTIRRFRNQRCEEDGNVRDHFDALSNLREQLGAMGRTVEDADYTDTLLASLPSAYDAAISSISASARLGSTPLSSEIFERFILDEYDRRQVRDKSKEPKDEALSTETSKKGKGKDKRKIECHNCHKKGHYKSECWAKGGGNEGGGPKRGGSSKDTATPAEAKEEPEAWAAMEQIGEPEDEVVSDAVAAAAGRNPARDQQTSSSRTTSELYDSGASRHMSPHRDRFVSYREIEPRAIAAADKRVFYAVGTGDLRIEVPNGEFPTPIILRDVLHAPDMGVTIVSVNRIAKAGYTVTFSHDVCSILNKSGTQVGSINASKNGLYKVDHAYLVTAPEERVDLGTLHRRLAHIAPAAIRKMVEGGAVEGIKLVDDGSTLICDACEQAKATRKEIKKEREAPLADAFGTEVHSDLWGPAPVPSMGGRRYYASFTDDHSRYTKLAIVRHKDGTLDAYKEFAQWVHTQHGVRIKRLRSDRGGEYTGEAFTKFLKEQGTERRLTTHDTPQHNGVAESLNRRIMERVRAFLAQSGLPNFLWAEAAQFVVWLKNRTPTKVLGNVTPYEKVTGLKPNLAGIPEWGQRVWVRRGKGNKLDMRALKAHWVGYDEQSTHAHRIYWPEDRWISVERDVRFMSDSVTVHTPLLGMNQRPDDAPGVTQRPPTPPPEPDPDPPAATDSGEEEIEVEGELDDLSLLPTPRKRAPKVQPPATQPTRQSTRLKKPSAIVRRIEAGEGTADGTPPPNAQTASLTTSHLDAPEHEFAYFADSEEVIANAIQETEGDPKTVPQARSRSDWPSWKDAMDSEMASLERALTWTSVPRPPGKNVVGSKWVFRLKHKADGSMDKYKARVVARGFTQIVGVDFYDTYSPVARLESFRVLLALAARFDWEIEAFDFNSAYLNGELGPDEEIYMEEPPGYETSGGGTVLRLRKALYGLKQAGRKWYEALSSALADIGFRVSSADPGVFIARIGPDILILAAHVDDCILTGSSPELISEYKLKLNDRYSLTDLGPVDSLLGIQITRDRAARKISLSQETFIKSILARFSLSDAKACNTPMLSPMTLSKQDSPQNATEAAHMSRVPYREAIGSLMYVSVATRPDITFAVSTLSQFLENPGEAHWEAVKHVYRYLSGTRDTVLTYGGERHGLIGYTDADGASQEHRRAISGYAFIIDGGAVSWSSRKQELVTLSTAEAEYVAATHAAKECLWLRRLIGDLHLHLATPTTLFCDNQAAIRLAHADNYHARTKHIDIRFHFIRDTIERGYVMFTYCPTDDMTADILTKALARWKVSKHALGLGLHRPCGGVLETDPGVAAQVKILARL